MMKDQVISILKSIRGDVDYQNCQSIIDDGFFSSLDLLQLISELETKMSISIPAEEIDASNFNSVDAIVDMINRIK